MEPTPSGGGWRRGALLFLAAIGLSTTGSLSLITIPFIGLAVVVGMRRLGTFVAAVVALWVSFGGVARDALWYLERGWAILLAGWFVMLTLVEPSGRFFSRALKATVGTFGVVGAFLLLDPGRWRDVDWSIRQALVDGAHSALAAVQALGGEPPSEMIVSAALRTAEQQGDLFPALLGLSSLAALGAAWWLYVKLAWGNDRGVEPLREFRFNDHMVWLLLAGLALLVLGAGEAWARVGSNTVVFMGALYALRGAAVVAFLTGGLSFAGGLFLVFAAVFLGPLVLGGAMIIGLGDTWLDVRTHAENAAESERS